jgi:hypothetical protein
MTLQIYNLLMSSYILTFEKPLNTNKFQDMFKKSTYKTFGNFFLCYKKSQLFRRFNLIKMSSHTSSQNGQIKKSLSKQPWLSQIGHIDLTFYQIDYLLGQVG